MRIRHRFLLGTGVLLAAVWGLFALEAREELAEAREDALARLTTLIERQERAISLFEDGESTVQDKAGRMLDPSGLSRYVSAQLLPVADYLCAVDLDGHAVMGAAIRPCSPSLERAVERGGSNWISEEGGEYRTTRTIVIDGQPHFLQVSQGVEEAMAPARAAVRVEVMYALAASALIVTAGYVWWRAVVGRIQTRKEARRERMIAHRALESMAQAALWIELDSDIILVNAAAIDMFGYSREKLLTMNVIELMPERYRARHLAGMARFAATGRSQVVRNTNRALIHGLRSDGAEFPLLLVPSTIEIDGEMLVVGILTDETERQADKDRIESQAATIARQQRELEQTVELAAIG